jgi:hypothetical protein
VEQTINTLIDAINVSLCFYIMGVVMLRLSMMSWATHKHTWIVIYSAAGITAACYLYMMVENEPHWRWSAMFSFVYTALWFVESRNRWVRRPPRYMLSSCPHMPVGAIMPAGCPLSNSRTNEPNS